MADKTLIEWSDATWNPTTGCTQIPGAHGFGSGRDNCYAKRLIDTRQFYNPTSVRFGHRFEEVMLHDERLDAPLRWKRPRRIFVNSLSDLFHAAVPREFIDRVFATMNAAPQHTFQVLTKRPERARRYLTAARAPHVAKLVLCVSVSSNADARRVRILEDTPVAVRGVSFEPLIGPVDRVPLRNIGWVIAGGESGPNARPMDLTWIRDLRDRSVDAGIPFFFKQYGGVSDKRGGDDAVLDGVRWTQFPEIGSAAS
jgi:protein gp37